MPRPYTMRLKGGYLHNESKGLVFTCDSYICDILGRTIAARKVDESHGGIGDCKLTLVVRKYRNQSYELESIEHDPDFK